jgi:predicted GTPase
MNFKKWKVVGEVNSGKGSFINALLDEEVCEVAPDPCTAGIQELVYANSIIRNHQTITENYIPRSDLVFFVFSVKNPHTATAWKFLSCVSYDHLSSRLEEDFRESPIESQKTCSKRCRPCLRNW